VSTTDLDHRRKRKMVLRPARGLPGSAAPTWRRPVASNLTATSAHHERSLPDPHPKAYDHQRAVENRSRRLNVRTNARRVDQRCTIWNRIAAGRHPLPGSTLEASGRQQQKIPRADQHATRWPKVTINYTLRGVTLPRTDLHLSRGRRLPATPIGMKRRCRPQVESTHTSD
jgi:hypothetical protein